ncbi:MAG: hypothetical protein QM767_25555 [Anaeromyxobacter sp.]
MSNHLHLLLTDVSARLPEFMQLAMSLIARALNPHVGNTENFWRPGSYNDVAVETDEAVVEQGAYTLANPVAANLVFDPGEWPGAFSDPAAFGTETVIARPEVFFLMDGDLPETATLRLTVPKGFASAAEFRERVVSRLDELVRLARDKARAKGKPFLGRQRVLDQAPLSRPTSPPPRRSPKPLVAARDPERLKQALARIREFLERYRAAWRKREAGTLAEIFPAGTYLLRVQHHQPCEAFG